jgi:tetratricopeptide (TPR) repeat protein
VARQEGALRQEVETALVQAVRLRKGSNFAQGRALLEQTNQRLEQAGPEDLRQRVKQALADLLLAEGLDKARLRIATFLGPNLDRDACEQDYAALLAWSGIGHKGEDAAVVAGWVRASAVRAEIVAALDDWASFTANDARRERLLAVAREADPHPWRDRLRQPRLWRNRAALIKLAGEAREAELSPQLATALGRVLGTEGEAAIPLLAAAQKRFPRDFWLNLTLAQALSDVRRVDEAVGFYRAALAGRPRSASGLVHYHLGNAMSKKGQFGKAVHHHQEALRLGPRYAAIHNNLGNALLASGQRDEGIRHYREALRLDPGHPQAHGNLGNVLLGQGRVDEAIVEYRHALAIDPKSNTSHHQIGICLYDQRRLDEAIVEYRRALAIDPSVARTHNQLGRCLHDQGHLDEALAAYRRSTQLEPRFAPPHYNIGLILRRRGQGEEAIAAFRKSVRFDPRGGHTHQALADTLLRQGRFAEGRAAARRGLELLPGNKGRPALEHRRAQAEKLIDLDGRLPALLAGKERPAADKLLALARQCRDHGRPYAAARLYAAGFAAKAALAEDAANRNRYDAACAACRASFAASDGPESARIDEPERARLRRLALGWLRADLAGTTRQLESGKLAGSVLVPWQDDEALARVRDPAALAQLPSDERKEWQRLWVDVAAALAADPLEKGRAHAARRQWGAAARCYTQALKRAAPDDGHFWFEYAAVLLLSGDRPGYARACAHMVARCEKAPSPRAYLVARACTLAPGAVADPALPGRLARAELTGAAGVAGSLTEQGALQYRAGKPAESVPFLEQGLRADPRAGRAVLNWLWLAPWSTSASARPRRPVAGWARARLGSIGTARGCRRVPRRNWPCTCTTGWRLTSCFARPSPCAARPGPLPDQGSSPHTRTFLTCPASAPPPADSNRLPSGLKRTRMTHSGPSSSLSTDRSPGAQSVILPLRPAVASTSPRGDQSTV